MTRSALILHSASALHPRATVAFTIVSNITAQQTAIAQYIALFKTDERWRSGALSGAVISAPARLLSQSFSLLQSSKSILVVSQPSFSNVIATTVKSWSDTPIESCYGYLTTLHGAMFYEVKEGMK